MQKTPNPDSAGKKPKRHIGSRILLSLLILLGFVCFFAAKWYVDVYGRLGFDSILYTLLSNLNGVQPGLIRSYLKGGLCPALLCTALTCFVLFFRAKRRIIMMLFRKLRVRLFPLSHPVSVLVSLVLSFSLILSAAINVELISYLKAISQFSTIYQQEYRDPATTQITFPEEKRNLVYIFMESMESTYLSTELGGGARDNLIPELYRLAQENVNFSHNDSVGGFDTVTATCWTIAAMVAQTSGVPLKTPPGIGGNDYGQDGTFLPGLTNLQDVLHDNGYYQVLMVGSDANFGSRRQYYTQHGIDRVCDYYAAIEDGIIPSDYLVWWGMEDSRLYEYAKQELTDLAAQDQPFAFTMLTADTHHISGYLCDLCEDVYDEQYENVIACASRQVWDFVSWLQEQDFYENTTVVVVGDHCSMDSAYFERSIDPDARRMVYNCFINAAAETDNSKNRQFSALDLFPTTLAAMGCRIEGERLGLGVNLFSDVPTLIEQMGFTEFNHELTLTSSYYLQQFLTGKRQ